MATRKTPSTTPRPSPFGAPRSGGTGTWPDDKTFLGDSSDPTSGITYIGAREYDPNSGRFISVDPVLDTSDPQSLNGYTYADNNPVTDSDPTGLWLDDGTGHNEPRSEGPSGPSSPALAYLRKKTGPGGCHYTCGPSGTTSSDSNGKAAGTDLANSLPRAENGWDGSRLHQVWVQYGYNTDGGGYWDAPVGDGDRTAMACYGRTACQEAAKVWANTHNLAAAKQVAATYCLYHAKRCTIDEGANNSMKDAAETVPILLAGELGAAGRAGGCLHSFVGGTEAQLADGSTKPIEDVLRISALGPLDGGGRGGLPTLGFWRRAVGTLWRIPLGTEVGTRLRLEETATTVKARILGLQPKEQVKRSNFRTRDSHSLARSTATPTARCWGRPLTPSGHWAGPSPRLSSHSSPPAPRATGFRTRLRPP
ncbi:RHS repeat-associated core domain-containing protein [Streptomyces mirabilis]|uniref:RHS repeat-associated core domain-containing protein n=1 Tax=Streptomyces mirabilis TaxID=68239 RepID=UPI0033DAAFF6